MSHPEIVESSLDGEQVAAEVPLGGEDRLLVTPKRTLIYRGEGLLSDESVEEYPHGAERVDVNEKRRKAEIVLDYGLDGTRSFSVPNDRIDDALHPVLAGVLSAANVTDAGETVKQTYRFSELTVVVTSQRLIKHIGGAVWDDEYRSFHYDDVIGLDFEEGSVATGVVLETEGRPERIKAPNEQARDLRERLENALFAYHDVTSHAELKAAVGGDEDEDAPSEHAEVAFDEGIDPLNTGSIGADDDIEAGGDSPTESDLTGADGATHEVPENEAIDGDAESEADAVVDRSEGRSVDDGRSSVEGTGAEMTAADVLGDELRAIGSDSSSSGSDADSTEPGEPTEAGSTDASGSAAETTTDEDGRADAAVEARLDELTETVERQTEAIERQRRTIEKLIEELSRGR